MFVAYRQGTESVHALPGGPRVSIHVSMQVHVAANDVAEWASAGRARARTATSRMMSFGSEDRSARDEMLIRMRDLRGSIEAIRRGVTPSGVAQTRTNEGVVGYGHPASYMGLRFVVRSFG